jgi:PAS domain-containing protein
MLNYTRVTDMVRRSDELQVLRNAIDNVEEGIVLIDETLVVQFVNKKARDYWGLTPELCQSKPTVVDYITHVRRTGLYGVPDDALADYVIKRVTMIKVGDQTPFDIPVKGGRTIRAQCTALAGGGRMLTYTEVTDLIDPRRAAGASGDDGCAHGPLQSAAIPAARRGRVGSVPALSAPLLASVLRYR